MRWLLFTLAVVNAHSFGSSSIGYAPNQVTACAPTDRCIGNRVCTFGTVANYNLARNAIFAATGRSQSCIDQCTCNANPRNPVAVKIEQAVVDPILYANNSLCTNQILKAAMYFQTAGYACDTVFREAQSDLIRLCGVQNGRPCNGKCTEWYQIDRPAPPCEERVGVDDTSWFLIILYILLTGMLWTWTSGIDLNHMRNKKLRQRFENTKVHDDMNIYEQFANIANWG